MKSVFSENSNKALVFSGDFFLSKAVKITELPPRHTLMNQKMIFHWRVRVLKNSINFRNITCLVSMALTT